ncbi:MAG: hypothetical protein ACKVP3_24225 [Hyphomicrobiaceae bacterium]
MHRSRTQIATAYAPGALFTYEGGMGCCVSVPLSAPAILPSAAVQKQLFDHLQDFVESWFDRAMRSRTAPAVLPQQCVDGAFLNHKNEPVADPGQFVLCQPSRIGFVPDPLVFVCSDCGLLQEFDGTQDLKQNWARTEKREDCPHASPKRHNWRQVDVIFAHWSGNYSGLSPYRYVMGPDGRVDKIRKCQNCNHDEYKLVTKGSPFFSDWRFQCVKCLSAKELVQADRETLELLKPRMDRGEGNLPKEWNMLPVSYRASSVFYAQKDSFILFRDADVISLLAAARREDLIARLMKIYNFPGTALDHQEVIRQLRANGRQAECREYEALVQILNLIPDALKPNQESSLAEKRANYEAAGLVARQHRESAALRSQVEANQDWARRYNPIRLGIEHASLRSEQVERQGSDPTLPAISVTNPDVCDIDKNDAAARSSYSAAVGQRLSQIGLDELVLLRGLEICEFSFGYTRVSSTPVTEVKERQMPVRLRAFSHAERNKRPIYLLQQKNEGFYLRLNEARVIRWLQANGINDQLPPRDGMQLGGLLIEQYEDFGRFLDQYRERTADSRALRTIPSYVYMLLHTMAHHFAHAVVEFSGLDHGSIGEYVFPADLSFLVYRKGMTPDLGNLSAMWRNHGQTVLDRLLWDRALKCDGGSLCDQRGGACPACIMAPDVACIASNNLLSRAALNGGEPPSWDIDRSRLTGFFRIP